MNELLSAEQIAREIAGFIEDNDSAIPIVKALHKIDSEIPQGMDLLAPRLLSALANQPPPTNK